MGFTLRPYQQAAIDAAINHLKKSRSPAILDLCVSAGKSIIVAEIAQWLTEQSKKKVLCLQPNKELTEQNYEAWLEYGNPASIWCAGLGRKEMRQDVVFATPRSVANSIEKFGEQFCAVIVDEAHAHKNAQVDIVVAMREHNNNLRVLGVTGTPYRLGDGFIFKTWPDGKPVGEDACKDPYYNRLLYSVTVPELMEQGYLTPPLLDVPEALPVSSEQWQEGKGTLTSEIVKNIIELTPNRRSVMIFGSTIDHCGEIMASLPDGSARLVTGETSRKERDRAVSDFKAYKYKYLVSQGIFTTGFNHTGVDCLAMLRQTESRGLFQQILGRGLRLNKDKKDVLILDYAGNIESHDLEDDLFKPEIKANWRSGEKTMVAAKCESCNGENEFTARPNPDEFAIDDNGYFLDLTGERVVTEGEQFLPAHYGRRCNHHRLIDGNYERCGGRWSYKACPDCGNEENDIAARKCNGCGAVLVDPNEKLKLDFKRMKRSPSEKSTDKVEGWFCQKWKSRAGNESLRIDWRTEYRGFSAWYSPDSKTTAGQALWSDLCKAVFGRTAPTIDHFIKALQKGAGVMPLTITSKKEGDFFKVYAHNLPEDKQP